MPSPLLPQLSPSLMRGVPLWLLTHSASYTRDATRGFIPIVPWHAVGAPGKNSECVTRWAGHVRVMQMQPRRDRFRGVTSVQAGHFRRQVPYPRLPEATTCQAAGTQPRSPVGEGSQPPRSGTEPKLWRRTHCRSGPRL